MKKTFKLVGVAMASVALLFASCSNDSISIETNATPNPDVVAIAYPGYNRIVWTPVTDGDTFSVIRDDGKKFSAYGWDGKDYDVEDGVEYTYTLYTNSTASDKTETKVGNKTSVKVKAIKPAYFGESGQTHALDLVYYEDGTYKADASQDFVVSAENIKVKSDGEKIFIQVPQKAYLDYTVKVYKGNSFELLPKPLDYTGTTASSANRAAIKKDKIKTDVTGLYSAEIFSAGEYRVEVTVKVENDEAYAEDKIIAKETAKIEALKVAAYTQNVKAVFTDTTNKKVRVMWTPAKDLDGKLYPATNYTVYAYDDNTKEVEKVTETIKESKKDGADIYYVETEKVNDKYVAVLSVEGKYEDINISNITSNELVQYETSNAFGSIDSLISSKYFTSLDSDGKNNDFVIKFHDYLTEKQKLTVKYFTFDSEKTDYYTSLGSNMFSEAFVSADYVKTGDIKTDSDTGEKTCTIKDVPDGQKVAYQITVSEEGKKDTVKSDTSNNVSRD